MDVVYWHQKDLWEIIFPKKTPWHPGNLLLIPPLPPQCLPLPVPYLPTFAWLSAVLTLVASYPLSFSFSTTTLPFLKPCSQLIKPCSQPAETFSQICSTCSNLSVPFLCYASTKLAQNSKIWFWFVNCCSCVLHLIVKAVVSVLDPWWISDATFCLFIRPIFWHFPPVQLVLAVHGHWTGWRFHACDLTIARTHWSALGR